MRRGLPFLGFIVLMFGAIFWSGDTSAQDETITNADQLAVVVDQSGLWYPLASVIEPSPADSALGVFWADFGQLTNAIGDVRNFEGQTQDGITVWRLRLTRTTNEVILSYPAADTNLWQATAPDGDDFSNHYQRVLWSWCILAAVRNYESYDDLIADGYTNLAPKRIVVDILLGDINDCSTYEANANGGGMFMVMTGEDSGDDLTPDFGIDGDPCAITNLLQRFSFTAIQRNTNLSTTVTWESCPIFRYILLSADLLTTNTIWQPQAYIWGQPGASATSWTDLSTTNTSVVTQRFYKVEKLLGNQIAAGAFHSLLVLTNSTLWAWGQGTQYQLGDGAADDEAAPVPITDSLCGPARLTNAVALAGGYDYSLAVDANGVVWSWGDGATGRLGTGGTTNVLTPSSISGINNVVSVAAGTDHTLALRADGTVWAWGDNSSGELGTGGPLTSTNSPVQLAGLSQIMAIAAGDQFSLALDASGRVWGWGENESGQIGTGAPTGPFNSSTNLPILVVGISNVVAIAAGDEHSVALTADKNVWTWGANANDQLGQSGSGPVPGLVAALTNLNVMAIAAGYQFTSAVTSNGQVYAWGDNEAGQLGTNENDVVNSLTPLLVGGISNVVLLSVHPDGYHSLAVTVNQGTNQYYAWGDDSEGQIGDGAADETPVGAGLEEDNRYPPALLKFDDVCTTCVPLGTSGSFTAQYTGTLRLYFNDVLGGAFQNNSGAYTAEVFAVGATNATNVIVQANNGQGVAVGIVTKGSNYTYSATGYCRWDPTKGFVDANGYFLNGTSADCTGFAAEGPCPNAHCFSLFGRIQ